MIDMNFRLSQDFIIDSSEKPWSVEGLRICIFGGAGSGKSWVAALLAEQFLSQGGTVVIFQPRSEYHTLREKFDIVIAGGVAKDIDFVASAPATWARAVSEKGISIVFYMTDVESEEKLIDFTSRFMHHLLKYQEVQKRPVMVILEEAQETIPKSPSGHIAPSWVYSRMIKAFKDGFLQGRKLNIIMVAISPRPQEVNFTIRQLANITLYGKFSPQDITYIDKECLKWHKQVSLKAEELLDLDTGQFLAVYGTYARLIRVTEPRMTTHGAITPELKFVTPMKAETKKAVSELVGELTKILEREKAEESELEKAKRRVHELEKQLSLAQDRIRQLETALEVKERLKIEVEPVKLPLTQPPIQPQPFKLPSVVERLSENEKRLWMILKQKGSMSKKDLKIASGLGRVKFEEAFKRLESLKLIVYKGRRATPKEPLV
jgi:hypothetical protein